MELRDLIGALEAPMLMGADNVDITNIQSDSRRVTKGSLFVAVRGTAVDGHAYMDSAIEKGAVAIVSSHGGGSGLGGGRPAPLRAGGRQPARQRRDLHPLWRDLGHRRLASGNQALAPD